jgi:hydrogenase nickel incorporation protein HypA/HybF
MHEASIALSILDIVTGKCSAEGYRSVTSVRVKIGRAAGIMPEALLFTFDVAKGETLAANAELIIDMIPLGGTCSACGEVFEVGNHYVLNCPKCGSAEFKIDRGYEMEIADMEVDE